MRTEPANTKKAESTVAAIVAAKHLTSVGVRFRLIQEKLIQKKHNVTPLAVGVAPSRHPCEGEGPCLEKDGFPPSRE